MAIRKLDAELLPKIRKLDVYAKQSMLSDIIEGSWTTNFKGHGIEFSGYRSYQFGDDASIIDWKASLRGKSILVKEYVEEKSVNVYFILDVSNSMLFTSTKKLKVEVGAELVSSMAYAVLRSGDAVGMSMVTDKLVTKTPISSGRKMHYYIVNDLLNLNNYGGNYDFNAIMKRLFTYLKSRAVVVIVSDFIGLSDDWYRYLRIASQKYQIIGIMIRDPRDRELPKTGGQFLIEDPYSGEKLYIDAKTYAKAYQKFVEEEELKIEKHFKASKSDLLRISTTEDIYPALSKFFKKRALTQRG